MRPFDSRRAFLARAGTILLLPGAAAFGSLVLPIGGTVPAVRPSELARALARLDAARVRWGELEAEYARRFRAEDTGDWQAEYDFTGGPMAAAFRAYAAAEESILEMIRPRRAIYCRGRLLVDAQALCEQTHSTLECWMLDIAAEDLVIVDGASHGR